MSVRRLSAGFVMIASLAMPVCAQSLAHEKDLLGPVSRAMHGFMVKTTSPVPDHPELQRAAFMCMGLPRPTIGHDQWDWGDCTARAVTDWLYVREMTGDLQTGRQVEQGQKAALLYVLSPDKGMAFVPDRSDLKAGKYHYQMWDQGRTLRALVHWWMAERDLAVKNDLQARIRKMIGSLSGLATRGEDPKCGRYAVYPWDNLTGSEPGHDIYCVRGGQLIEPLVLYWEATGDPAVRAFIDELYAGVRSGAEGAAYDPAHKGLFIFAEDGSFNGHFHAHMSTVLGAAMYGRAMCREGQTARGLEMLKWAKQVYDWTRAPQNVNAASSWGWFPENMGPDGKSARELSETCCVADMVELAAVLADTATLAPELASCDSLWDDVERYAINYMLAAQFVVSDRYKQLLSETALPVNGLHTGYVDFNLDASGCYNHETAGAQIMRSEWRGAVSQITYSLVYDGKTSAFLYKPGQPIQPEGFEIERPSEKRDGVVRGAVVTADRRIRIRSETRAGDGPYVVRTFVVSNVGSSKASDVQLRLVVNADSPDWMNDSAEADEAKGTAFVHNGFWWMGMGADLPVTRWVIGDAEAMLGGRIEPGHGKYQGNVALAGIWQIGTLEPGAGKSVTVTLAVGPDQAGTVKALNHESFPKRQAGDTTQDLLALAGRLEGTWVSCLYPNEIVSRDDQNQRLFYVGGCCAYSGPRGVYACWKSAVHDDGRTLSLRMPISRACRAANVHVFEDQQARQVIELFEPRRLRVRIPDWASIDEVRVHAANNEVLKHAFEGRWVVVDAHPDTHRVLVRYPMKQRSTQERYGGRGAGQGFAPADAKRTFKINWQGNRVMSIEPAGTDLPPFPILRSK